MSIDQTKNSTTRNYYLTGGTSSRNKGVIDIIILGL